jgi:hypothetical protein
MGEQVFSHVLVDHIAGFVFNRSATGGGGTVGTARVAADVRVGDEAAGVFVGEGCLIDIDQRAVVVQA